MLQCRELDVRRAVPCPQLPPHPSWGGGGAAECEADWLTAMCDTRIDPDGSCCCASTLGLLCPMFCFWLCRMSSLVPVPHDHHTHGGAWKGVGKEVFLFVICPVELKSF